MASQAFTDLKTAVDAVVVFVGSLKSKEASDEAALAAANADLASRDADLATVTKQLTDLVAAG